MKYSTRSRSLPRGRLSCSSYPPAPIPDALRSRLEYSFDASLSAIRMVWMTELSCIGLAGAACGDLVMLNPCVVNLESPDEIAVLAHEVAHSLQQRPWKLGTAVGGSALRVVDPVLEEAADWAASAVRRSARVPHAVRDVGEGWKPSQATRLSRCDCGFAETMRRRGLPFPAMHLQARKAGDITYYGGDVSTCPACSQPTVGTHELASHQFIELLCGRLLINLHGLGGKAETERISGGTATGYMTGVLWTKTGKVYGACSGPADSIPPAFDTAVQLTSVLGCRDDLDRDRLRTRGGRRIDPALVYAAPNSNLPGNCAAPKLIQQCYTDGELPVNMVEMFYGHDSPVNGMVIESCDTCKNLLPPMLCPNV
jgi:hypothetical protein